jgi:hypothetical protein
VSSLVIPKSLIKSPAPHIIYYISIIVNLESSIFRSSSKKEITNSFRAAEKVQKEVWHSGDKVSKLNTIRISIITYSGSDNNTTIREASMVIRVAMDC